MKTCPICNAKTFDDMDVCYGCLYRFDEKRPSSNPDGVGSAPGGDVEARSKRASAMERENDCLVQEAKGAKCEVQNKERAETDFNDERVFVINVPLPQEVKGVRVAVDFDILRDSHVRIDKGEGLAD